MGWFYGYAAIGNYSALVVSIRAIEKSKKLLKSLHSFVRILECVSLYSFIFRFPNLPLKKSDN